MERRKNSAKSILRMLLAMLAAIVTIYLGWKYAERQYYVVSVLLIIYFMLPFFLMFEQRRPQARELVVIAVLSAIAVVSRVLFIWAPNFKPLVAIVIITGVAFGPESGFLTGALAAFVSNFIFGQGAWTPWQMFAYGLSGFLAGLLYQAGILSKNRIPLTVFGFLCTFLIVGPVLDTCAVFLQPAAIDWSKMKLLYLSGIPVNLVHASCVALTLLLFSQPMFEKLDRIKDKYGMMEG